ncbi:MFS transporter [Streptomyces diastatochromogenes]|nr:MFS transporter [Streptomyces diastatochromogenes]
MPVVRDLRVLLRLTNFRRLLAVRLLSQCADGVYQVALATYVVFSPEKQTSPGAIASAMAVLLLPYSLVGPFAGVLLDRWQRRQVFLYGNLLRALLACGTALLVLASVPDWLFYASALSVTAVNRFVLAGLSASLPRVVDEERLVMANSLSPTAGTLAATVGGGLAFGVRLLAHDSDAIVVAFGAVLYLCAGLASLRMSRSSSAPIPTPRRWTWPRPSRRRPGVWPRAAPPRRTPPAARALTVVTFMRFCYGALLVSVLMLCRYAWSSTDSEGLGLLGLAVAASGAGSSRPPSSPLGGRTVRALRLDDRVHGRGRRPRTGARPDLHPDPLPRRRLPPRAHHPGGQDRDGHGGPEGRRRLLSRPGLLALRRAVQRRLRGGGGRRGADAAARRPLSPPRRAGGRDLRGTRPGTGPGMPEGVMFHVKHHPSRASIGPVFHGFT